MNTTSDIVRVAIALTVLALAAAVVMVVSHNDSPATITTEPAAASTPAEDEPMDAPADFAADLEASKIIVKTDIDEPCDSGDPTWILEGATNPPPLVPVAGADTNGNCVIVGWSYQEGIDSDAMDLPVVDGYVLQPIFDGEGRLTGYHEPGPATELPNGPFGED